jgi:hypothetical protein
MAPLFHAYDHFNYSRILHQHLNELADFPSFIIEHFHNGGFVANLSETHETTINLDINSAITSPDSNRLETQATHLPYRARSLNIFRTILFPERNDAQHRDPQPNVVAKHEGNVSCYISKIEIASIPPFMISLVSKYFIQLKLLEIDKRICWNSLNVGKNITKPMFQTCF